MFGDPDVSESRCGVGAPWCARADEMLNVPGLHVLDVAHDDVGRLVVTVESDEVLTGCRSCGVVAVGHGRRVHRVHDAPAFGTSVLIRWRKRIWRCPDPGCPVATFSETHELIAPRAKLTARAITWATDALAHDDTTVAALARHLGVDWHTCWDAIETEAIRRLADPARMDGVVTLGVDEHIWKPSHHGGDRAVTSMVDLTRDQAGNVRARLLDVVPGRSGTAYSRWLAAQPEGFTSTIEHAALDPFRGYANAIRDELPDAVAVLDAFHVVKLGTACVDQVAAASSKTPSVTAGTRTTRSTGSAAYCATASSTSPPARSPASSKPWTPGTRTGKSPPPGPATSGCARSTTSAPQPPARPSPRTSSRPCTPARSPRSPASDGPCEPGALRSWPTSTPTASPTAAPKPST